MDKELTIACCWTNESQLESFIESVKKQTISVELLLIDNRESKYTSCSGAFNSVIDQIQTKYVIFSHQDIILFHNDTLEKFIGYLEKLNEQDILGVAGADPDVSRIITNVRSSENAIDKNNNKFGLKKCQTLDECFFGGYSEKFRNEHFDEIICSNWHLYAVEMCLRTISRGYTPYVCDVEIIHLSAGKVNYIYNQEFYSLCKKYKEHLPVIKTPCCYCTKTNFPYREIKLLKSNLRVFLDR